MRFLRGWLCLLLAAGLFALAGCGWDDDLRPQTQVAVFRPPPAPALPPEVRADLVEVYKSRHLMLLKDDGAVLRRYRVMLGLNPVGHKQREGDKRTPEGLYLLDYRNPQSHFYRSLHISYPNAADIVSGRARGEARLGGDIFIHGMGFAYDAPLYVGMDWTDGCIAVTNREMAEIWTLVPDGTPIRIYP
jgi:murein L,D-transpeptidase YafK